MQILPVRDITHLWGTILFLLYLIFEAWCCLQSAETLDGPSRFKHRSTDNPNTDAANMVRKEFTSPLCHDSAANARSDGAHGWSWEGVCAEHQCGHFAWCAQGWGDAEGGTNSVRSKSISCVSVRARVTPNWTCALGARLVFFGTPQCDLA